jgi:hypothetical protein
MTDFRKGRREFTKKDAKEQQANFEILSQRLETATTLLFGLSKRVFEMDKKLRQVTREANAAQWRSAALVEIETPEIKAMIAKKAEELQIKDFEQDAAEFDKLNNLIPAQSAAENGFFATVSMEYFKDGQKLEEQKTVRSKIHLGQHELFPELDAQIVGMSVGETKKFPLNLMGLTDEVEVHLIDLKKPQPKEEPKNEPAKTEGQ